MGAPALGNGSQHAQMHEMRICNVEMHLMHRWGDTDRFMEGHVLLYWLPLRFVDTVYCVRRVSSPTHARDIGMISG